MEELLFTDGELSLSEGEEPLESVQVDVDAASQFSGASQEVKTPLIKSRAIICRRTVIFFILLFYERE